MRILITSGGTQVPIDPVRAIKNNSTGRFGSDLARAALEADLQVTYLVSSEGKSPFVESISYSAGIEKNTATATQLKSFGDRYFKNYHENRYKDFDDYYAQLKQLITAEKPDIIILAAAVSDYLVENFTDTKVRSSESLVINLRTAPKIIHSVKQWQPSAFLVGFKLLVNSTQEELIAVAKASLETHQADLVVANDLSTLQRGQHEIFIVEKDGSFQHHTQNLATAVISHCLRSMSQ